MEGEVITGMEALITNITPMVTEAFSLIGDVASCIVSQPILLMQTGIFLAGAGIALFSRVLSKR